MLDFFLIVLGFFLLIKGADFLVDGASDIAKRFHIPEIVIGLTIVSIGTSMPELVVSLTSALQGHSDIAIGNVVGSNLANMFLILGICSIIKPLGFQKQTKLIENPITVFVTIIFFIFCTNGYYENNNIITRAEGAILLLMCILYIIYNIVMARRSEKQIFENSKSINILKSVIYVILGIIALKFGGDYVVDGCVSIAEKLKISDDLISLTIIAISTSLPELITSITATKKGETDMAIGNVLGSQIFNILLIIGASALFCPINYTVGYNKYIIILILGSMMLSLFPFIGQVNKMEKKEGIIFVMIYFLYISRLFFD